MKIKVSRSGFLFSMNFFVLGFLGTAIGVLIPDLKIAYGINNEQAGLLFVCWSTGSFAGAYLGGWIYNHGRERAIFAASSLGCIGLIAMVSGAASSIIFGAAIFLLSILSSVLFTAGHAAVTRTAVNGKASKLSLMDFFVSSGNLATPLIAAVLPLVMTQMLVWKAVFLIASLPFICVLVALHAPLGPNSREMGSEKEAEKIRTVGYFGLLSQPIFLGFLAVSILLHAAEWAHSVWFVSYAQSALSLSVEDARAILGLFLGGMALSRLLCSRILHKFDSRMVLIAFAVAAAVCACAMLGRNGAASLAAINFAMGFFFGVSFPVLLGLTMELSPSESSRLSGLGLMGGTLGAQGLAYTVGALADHTSLGDAYRLVPLVMSIFALSVVVFVMAYPRARVNRLRIHHAAVPEEGGICR